MEMDEVPFAEVDRIVCILYFFSPVHLSLSMSIWDWLKSAETEFNLVSPFNFL